jgi:hypothetical protein
MDLTTAYELKSAFLLIIMMMFGGVVAVRFAYANIFMTTYDPRAFFSLQSRDDINTGIRLLSTENLFITLILASFLSFGLCILNYFVLDNPIQIIQLSSSLVATVIVNWLILIVIVGLYFLLKFFYIKLVGWLFNFPDQQSGHFQEYQAIGHVFYFFYTLLMMVIVISVLHINSTFVDWSLLLLAVFLVYRIILLTSRLNARSDFSIFYIFSYICTTEIIPLALAVIITTQKGA